MSVECGPESYGQPSAAGRADLCAPFLAALPVDGVAISVLARGNAPSTVCVTDPVATRLDELHFELGEGPYWDVMRTGRVVSVPDLRHVDISPWPVFASATRTLDVGGLFAFP